MRGLIFYSIFSFLCIGSVFAKGEDEKNPPAHRVLWAAREDQARPTIDGYMNEAFWQDTVGTGKIHFYQYEPHNGERATRSTQVKVKYTDDALYIVARMYDPNPQTIAKEYGLRDDDGTNADMFGVMLDTYGNGLNAFYFEVSAAGVQTDVSISKNGWDYNWNGVWNSAVNIDDKGWTVEMEIPYSALRFPKQDEQQWHVNFMRRVQENKSVAYWNYVDNAQSGLVNQAGTIKGIHNINPPLRLSLSPYLTTSYTHNGADHSNDVSVSGGMDIKYGINESFTLDMTLIPDFSQVPSDNLILNLGPYETKYAENRPFFTEGTDLFSKDGLFYSRRIGQSFGSVNYDDNTEEVIYNPGKAPLLNAVKVSGRNKNGLALGVLNAVTNATFAKIRNKETGEVREERVDDVTNFNIAVADQNLPNNSNFGVINTNVKRFGKGRDANVTGSELVLKDKSNTYQFYAFGAFSHVDKKEDGIKDGYKYTMQASKISGNFRVDLGRNVESAKYDVNDFGYIQSPNELSHWAEFSYRQLTPGEHLNRWQVHLNTYYSQLYKPREFRSFQLNTGVWMQAKNFWEYAVSMNYSPLKNYDFNEPRVDGWKFYRPENYNVNLSMGSDGRDAFAFSGHLGMWNAPARNQLDYWVGFNPRYRLSDHLSLHYSFSYNKQNSSIGYADQVEDNAGNVTNIIFGERNIDSYTNTLGLNFILNEKMGLNLRMRHYWSKVDYFKFYNLQSDGDIKPTSFAENNSDGVSQYDTNFNAFNIDAVYAWQIAPGSYVNFVWKDAIIQSGADVHMNFGENLQHTLAEPQTNNVSIRLIYYLDYLNIRQWIKG